MGKVIEKQIFYPSFTEGNNINYEKGPLTKSTSIIEPEDRISISENINSDISDTDFQNLLKEAKNYSLNYGREEKAQFHLTDNRENSSDFISPEEYIKLSENDSLPEEISEPEIPEEEIPEEEVKDPESMIREHAESEHKEMICSWLQNWVQSNEAERKRMVLLIGMRQNINQINAEIIAGKRATNSAIRAGFFAALFGVAE